MNLNKTPHCYRFSLGNEQGFSVVELIVVSVILVFMMFSLMSFSKILGKSQVQSNLTFQADSIRRQLTTLLNNSAAWQKTIAATQNTRANGSALDCLVSPGTPCTTTGTDISGGGVAIQNYPINAVLDTAGNVFYDSTSPTQGFTAAGSPCNTFVAPPATGTDACPLRFQITWSAVCSSTSCTNPQVNLSVVPVYNPSSSPNRKIAFNAQNYSSNSVQGSSGKSLRLLGSLPTSGGNSQTVSYAGSSPAGWIKVPGTCANSLGAYCNQNADAINYLQVPFTVNSTSDFFLIMASARYCSTVSPSMNCWPMAPNTHGMAISVFDAAETANYFHQDIDISTSSNVMASGSVYVTNLQPGNYVAMVRVFEETGGHFLTFAYNRQIAVFQLQ